eukprot:scaffold54701_cov43-Prasinocladus_malaysianus.AAC.1
MGSRQLGPGYLGRSQRLPRRHSLGPHPPAERLRGQQNDVGTHGAGGVGELEVADAPRDIGLTRWHAEAMVAPGGGRRVRDGRGGPAGPLWARADRQPPRRRRLFGLRVGRRDRPGVARHPGDAPAWRDRAGGTYSAVAILCHINTHPFFKVFVKRPNSKFS